MGKGSRPQRILWRSIWANYFPALIPFHFLCEGNNFTLLPTSLSTNMCDQRIILAEKNKTALNMILFHTGYTDWVTIRYLRQKRPKKVLSGRAPCCIPLLCWWRTYASEEYFFCWGKIGQLWRWSCSTGYTDWATITSLRQKWPKKVLQGRAPCCIPPLCWWRTRANYICIVERNWWLLVTNERGRKLWWVW